jgi:hypothetical protein
MLEITNKLRPVSLIAPYPNYHKGDYFEEYFFKRFLVDYPSLTVNNRVYLPIFWTNCYTNKSFVGKKYDIQNILNLLNKDNRYFTISQHDDCVYEKLPIDTIVFSMGGNKTGENIIPIPLICSPINYDNKEKNIKVSFVGSITHNIRSQIYEEYKECDLFEFHVKAWELNTKEENINRFLDVTSRSEFTLCPRGYGKTSFRLYESMQLNSVPIYVYDEEWLPWTNEIDWDKLIIKINSKNIKDIKNIILNTDITPLIEYKNKIYDSYFTFDGVYKNIIKQLEKW